MNKVALALCLAVSVMFGAVQVPVEVLNWADVARVGEPVTAGVPLHQGTVYDLAKLRIVDGNGQTVPAQFRILSRYWKEKNLGLNNNPSVKWVLCDFQSDAAAKNKTSYTLKDDNTASQPSTQLSVMDSTGSVTVVTGPLKFRLSKTRFNIIDEAWLDANTNGQFENGEKIIASTPNNGLSLTAGDWQAGACTTGTVHTMSAQAPERVVIEESGPMKTVIRVEGRHYASSGGVAKGLYGWQVFITAYAGKAYVDIQVGLTNTLIEGNKPELGSTPWTSYVWPISSAVLNLNVNLGSTKTYGLLAAAELSGSASSTPVRLLQKKGAYTVTGAAGGTAALGGASLSDGTLGLQVVMRDFAPNTPKAISITDSKIQFELFPDTGAGSRYWLDPNSRKNHRFRFNFTSGAYQSGALTTLWKQNDAPLRMLAPQAWYRDTRAWERGFGIPAGWPRKANSAWTRLDKPSTSDWVGFAAIGEFNGTGDHWNLTSCFWAYLLTGNPSDFEYAEARVHHFNDLVSVQTGATRWTDLATWADGENNIATISALHNPEDHYNLVIKSFTGFTWNRGNIPDAGHMTNKQNLEYYLLTGDHATKDAIESEGIRARCQLFWRTYGPYSGWPYSVHKGSKVNLDSFMVMSYGPRYICRPGLVAMAAYDITGDDRYLYTGKIAAYSMRNYTRANPIGYVAAAGDATYLDTAGAGNMWRANGGTGSSPTYHSGSDFQIGIALQELYHYWEQTGDEEIRDGLILGTKGLEWRAGIDATTKAYTGFVYSGWGDYPAKGKRYTGATFTSSASEGFGGYIFGYMASGMRSLYPLMMDGKKSFLNFDPNGNQREMKVINLWEAIYRHDSLDNVPPATITNLSGVSVQGSAVRLSWTAPGGDSVSGRASSYQVKVARAPIVDMVRRWNDTIGWPDLRDTLPRTAAALIAKAKNYMDKEEISFWAAQNIVGEPIPSAAGTPETFTATALPESTDLYFALVSYDSIGNVSGISNVIKVKTVAAEKQINEDKTLKLFENIPNPFNPITAIGFNIPSVQKSTSIRIAVYDAAGRIVRALASGDFPPGFHQVIWNGCDNAGRNVGSGIYVVRLTAQGKILERKMTLVR
ncbi:MAG: hypothetical protein JNL74_11615 [Fibrobacteres bacterium]|nr:hypothetical protein [Fibrobacterota bacterium]